MKYFILLNIFFLFWSKFNRISEMNTLKETAANHFERKEYAKSILLYKKLLTNYNEEDERVKLNLAHCYFYLKKYNSAIDTYKFLVNSKDAELKSLSYLQLGVIYSNNNKKELGLSYFKEALKAMPENEAARYNFELLRKDQEEQLKENSPEKKKENDKGKNKTSYSTSEELKKSESGAENKNTSNNSEAAGEEGDTENTGGEDEEDQMQQQDNGNKKSDALLSKRLEEMNMNERQARMILKTMKNSEVQYFQQRKKILSTKPMPGRPDW